MLNAALASVLIASCYDGDTCTTTRRKIQFARIDTPELQGKRTDPIPAIEARDHLRALVVDAPLASAELPRIAMAAPWRNYLLMARTSSNSW